MATLRYIYDGWNLVATLRIASSTELAASYVWGNDLSGSEQGAGGVGGLLFSRFYPAFNYSGTPPTLVYYGYDGNGNVSVLYNPASQTVAAAYEYDAFGQILRQTGPTAATNPFRFSTKFTDDESGLNYYGFRYYSPWMGRWISRDPLGERGGSNTYKILNNDLLFHVDFLGLTEVDAAIARSQAKSLVEDARESNRKQLEKRRDEQNERARRVDETMKKNAERGDYKCCDDKKNAEGKQRLQNAHANAKARVNTEFKPDPSDPDSGPSCKNTHRWILEEMGSFPTCWTCALEERDGLAYRRRIQHLGIGDHCTIRCIAVDKSGKVKDQLFFDYAYNYADKYDEFKTDYPSIPENNGIPYHPGPTPLQCVNCNVRVSPRE